MATLLTQFTLRHETLEPFTVWLDCNVDPTVDPVYFGAALIGSSVTSWVLGKWNGSAVTNPTGSTFPWSAPAVTPSLVGPTSQIPMTAGDWILYAKVVDVSAAPVDPVARITVA